MSCEGTGLGALGPLAGYWEKIQERSASLETCPWCAAKGQTQALRSYRISVQEFITLCTDPQCLFPLVSRPLEDVLASLVPPLPQTQTGRKRKSPSGLENGETAPSPKSARSEEAISQNETRPVIRITSAKLNGEDCFNRTKHTTPRQKERISQSEPTDMELVDKTLNYPLLERGGANGYHKDSDWPIPEEMDQEVLEEEEEGVDGVFLPDEGTPALGKGLPIPEKAVPTSQPAVFFVDTEPAPKEVFCPLDEAVFALEETLSVRRVAVSAPEKILPPLHLAVSTSKNVAAPEKALAPPVTVPNLQDPVHLLEPLIAPGEAVSLLEEALPVPGEAVSLLEESLHVPGEAVSLLEEALPVPGEAVSLLEEALPVPGEAVSLLEEALPVPGEAVSLLEEALPVPGEAVSLLEEALPVPGEAVSLLEEALPVPGEAVSLLEEALPVPGEAVSLLEEALPVPGEAVSAMEEDAEVKEPVPTMEAVLVSQEGLSDLQKDKKEEEVLIALEKEEEVSALVALEAVSMPAMVEVVPALEKDEEDEKIQEEECPPQGVCRPCRVDLSQSKVPDGHVAGDEEDDGTIRAIRRAHSARQLSSEDEEQEVSVKEEVEVLTPPPKKKRGRPRKASVMKYTQEVLSDFDPEVISTGELVPVPGPHLFWRNENRLGWLDALLVALVHCRTLRDRRATERPTVGQPVWDLCERYDRACSLSTAYQHTGADGVVRVPSAVLQWVQTEMQTVRMVIFKLLEPLLNCKLGQNETLAFVLPLLLEADSWAEPLFQHAYDWQFECISATCQHATKTKCKTTLTTFTKVATDWHPLNAANQSRCSKCNKMKQARMLVLERLSPVFALHFSEGLPDNDLSTYSFTFRQQRYSITTVLQYDQPLEHFVSWIRRRDGSWLEFNDLKHPDCVSHAQLVVPPREMRVVFWELETDRPDNPQTPCSSHSKTPTSTSLIQKELKQPHLAKLFVVNESPDFSQTVSDDAGIDMDTIITAGYIDNNTDTTLKNNVDSPIVIGSTSVLADVPLPPWSHDLSLPLPLNDTAVVEALTVSDNTDNDITDTTVTAGNPSIGSATLLDTFEGLSHDDIVTLTLVEVKMDSESRPLDDVTPAPKQNGRDVCFLSETETPPSAHEIPTESETPPETDDEDFVERPTSPDTASEFLPDSSDGLSETDSEEVTPSPPKVRRGSNRQRIVSNTQHPVAAAAKVVTSTTTTATPMALHGNCGEIILPSVVAMMSPSYVEPSATAPESPPPPPPHPKTPNTSNSLQSTPGLPPPPDPNSHWSYRLTRHPTSTPSTQRPPSQLNHSTPNRFQQISQSRQIPNPDARLKKPPPLPKPKLSKEDSEALPVKAAEMYGGFQARSRNVNINNVPSKTSPPTQLPSQRIDSQNGIWKTPSQPGALALRKPPIDNTTAACPIKTSLPSSLGVTELHKISSSRNQGPGGQVSKVPAGLSETEALRYKLLKKLKAKKKKLEKLNQMLGYQGAAGGQEVTRRPDCDDLRSPSTVSSSTSAYDSPAYDEFFADLLSPATTASNLSPDSTGFLEMLTTNGQEGGGNLACGGNAIGGASQVVTPATLQPANHGVVMPLPGLDGPIMTSGENFLEEFISGSANQQMETEALSAFDLFF